MGVWADVTTIGVILRGLGVVAASEDMKPEVGEAATVNIGINN